MYVKGIWQYKLSLSDLKVKMIYKLPLQLFRILLGFRNRSTYFDQNQRACIPPSWICIRYACVTSRVKRAKFLSANHMFITIKLDFPSSVVLLVLPKYFNI